MAIKFIPPWQASPSVFLKAGEKCIKEVKCKAFLYNYYINSFLTVPLGRHSPSVDGKEGGRGSEGGRPDEPIFYLIMEL